MARGVWGTSGGWLDPDLSECEWVACTCNNESVLEGLNFTYFAIRLAGKNPMELGLLTALVALAVTTNKLIGSIPTELGNLSNLQSLWLTDNVLSGTLPTELAQLSQLEQLVLSYNFLTRTVPTEFAKLTSLRRLNLDFQLVRRNSAVRVGELERLDSSQYGIQQFGWDAVLNVVRDLRLTHSHSTSQVTN